MSKKHFIALANHIRLHREAFSDAAIYELAKFCRFENARFLESRWLGYINGTCGPNGGAINPVKGA